MVAAHSGEGGGHAREANGGAGAGAGGRGVGVCPDAVHAGRAGAAAGRARRQRPRADTGRAARQGGAALLLALVLTAVPGLRGPRAVARTAVRRPALRGAGRLRRGVGRGAGRRGGEGASAVALALGRAGRPDRDGVGGRSLPVLRADRRPGARPAPAPRAAAGGVAGGARGGAAGGGLIHTSTALPSRADRASASSTRSVFTASSGSGDT